MASSVETALLSDLRVNKKTLDITKKMKDGKCFLATSYEIITHAIMYWIYRNFYSES
jgi:hypothetical protein